MTDRYNGIGDELVPSPDFEAAARTADLNNDAQPYIGERATRDNIDAILAQGREYWRRVFMGAGS